MQYLYGIHAIKAALLSTHFSIQNLYVNVNRNDTRILELVELATNKQVPVQRLTAHQLQEMSTIEYSHQDVLATCQEIPVFGEDDLQLMYETLSDQALFLLLDGVQDPNNLGACLRTANAMGVLAVIAPKNRAATLTAAAIKVASGAAGVVPFVQVTNLARTMRDLQEQGIWLYGADLGAHSAPLWNMDCNRKLGIVLGSEGQGLRHLTRQHCDQLIQIPQYGQVASLNVSVATGICLYEVRRQQGFNNAV